MTSPQIPGQPSRPRQFWTRRSWKGKTALIVGTVFLALLVIGYAVPAEQEGPKGPPEAEAAIPTTEQGTTEAQTTTEATTAPPPPFLVADVTDGDTIALDNGKRIRLVQIDAPERKGGCYGRKSAQVLRQLLPVSTEVRIVRDENLDDLDRYGRLLRYVFKGRKNINLALVQRGSARRVVL